MTEKFTLDKGFVYKLFMFVAFSIFALVMYQGYLTGEMIYTILFFASVALCSFQIASTIYVLFVKREVEITIDDKNFIWKIYDNNKLTKEISIELEKVKEVKTEINYLTGNIYSRFTITFQLDDDKTIELTDGLIYDFGLKKAEDVSRFLLKNNLGDPQDIKFTKLIEKMNIDLTKEQKFSKKENDSFYFGVISKRKKEFLSLRLQIEALYKDYKIVELNANNAYKVKDLEDESKFIYLRSNAFGFFVEFYKVKKAEELKMLKEMGRQKIGF